MDPVSAVYAQALLELVGDGSVLEEVEEELNGIREAFFSDPDVRDFVLSPILKKEQKESILLAALEGKVKELVFSFIGVLNLKDRLGLLPEICEAFSGGVDRIRGRWRAVVVSREDLSSEIIERIRSALETRFRKKILIENRTDPGIIGGFVIQMEDYRIDASIRTQLQGIRKSLLSKKITVGAIYEN